jgi:hypothetical protein
MRAPLLFLVSVLLLFSACSDLREKKKKADKASLQELVTSFESHADALEKEIDSVAVFYDSLIRNKDQILKQLEGYKYKMNGPFSEGLYIKDDNYSSIIILNSAEDYAISRQEVKYTNGLDEIFSKVFHRYDIIAQIYSNSENQVSRVYPFYDAAGIVDPNINVKDFNFYYKADKENNPSRGYVWIPEPYIDPAGQGWILSLIKPVYDQDELFAVLGIDITVDHLIQRFLEDTNGDYLIVNKKGDIVAGKSTAIEALSMPPLKNHVYRETIRSDNFRISDFNLFNSKSREVRKMGQAFLLESKDQFEFKEESYLSDAVCRAFKEIEWYAIKINIKS